MEILDLVDLSLVPPGVELPEKCFTIRGDVAICALLVIYVLPSLHCRKSRKVLVEKGMLNSFIEYWNNL